MTKSEELLERDRIFNSVEKAADRFGRLIGVRLLKPSEELKVRELAPSLDGYDKAQNDKGEEILISHRAPLAVAACVCQIDGRPVTFPKSRAELDSILDLLGKEGLTAAISGLDVLQKQVNNFDVSIDPVDAAKNLAGTQ